MSAFRRLKRATAIEVRIGSAIIAQRINWRRLSFNDGELGKANQVIEMALAGFDKSDIQIACGPNKSLIIGCEKSEDRDAGATNRRIARRSFKKTFFDYHNQLDFNKSKATFENGLLRVTIPLIEEAEYKVIEIE